MAVTQQDFQQFFQEKKLGTYKCPFCANEQFVANLGGHGATAVLRHHTDTAAGYHDFLSFSCTNCGHTDFFHITQFNKWQQEKLDEQKDG
jgi:predicted nucleic-acid-binding Zn-ribbon protein